MTPRPIPLGPFELIAPLGHGGMAVVWEGTHREQGVPVAVKVITATHAREEKFLHAFRNEVQAVASLEHPGIVMVLDHGAVTEEAAAMSDERLTAGSPYLAMELLAGYDLASYLREHTRMVVPEIVELVAQVARALTAAQEAGIVHRDLKPQNIYFARAGDDENIDGIWKVLDFGISKVGQGGDTITHGAVIGTPSFMSPEQARGLPVDHRSDVFALGVIAYRAMTGRPVFTASEHLVTMHRIMHAQPARPSEFVAVRSDVDLVMALALAKYARFGSKRVK